jgi:hypothetical protein
VNVIDRVKKLASKISAEWIGTLKISKRHLSGLNVYWSAPPSSTEVTNTWSYTSTLQYAFFTAWCLVKHGDNFTFTLRHVWSGKGLYGRSSISGRGKGFLTVSRPVLVPSVEVMNALNFHSISPIRLHGVVSRRRDKYTFHLHQLLRKSILRKMVKFNLSLMWR